MGGGHHGLMVEPPDSNPSNFFTKESLRIKSPLSLNLYLTTSPSHSLMAFYLQPPLSPIAFYLQSPFSRSTHTSPLSHSTHSDYIESCAQTIKNH